MNTDIIHLNVIFVKLKLMIHVFLYQLCEIDNH